MLAFQIPMNFKPSRAVCIDSCQCTNFTSVHICAFTFTASHHFRFQLSHSLHLIFVWANTVRTSCNKSPTISSMNVFSIFVKLIISKRTFEIALRIEIIAGYRHEKLIGFFGEHWKRSTTNFWKIRMCQLISKFFISQLIAFRRYLPCARCAYQRTFFAGLKIISKSRAKLTVSQCSRQRNSYWRPTIPHRNIHADSK